MRLSWLLVLPLAAALRAAVELPPAFDDDYDYDQEAYGWHPTQKFRSIPVEVPKLNIIKTNPKCETSLYTMFTPRGDLTNLPQLTIMDHEGHLVYTIPWNGQQMYNLQVQEYKGEKYLTFWAGDDTVGGHGAGTIFMLDHHYNVYRNVSAGNQRNADLHDFTITEQGTATLTVYEIVLRDLHDAGKDHWGPVWDCIVQEIDLETGETLFEWRATDHVPLGDSYREIAAEGEPDVPYDYYHLNSIEKDSQGNYLISGRYTYSISYINGTTGDVIWIMGGKHNMFRDLSGGNATNFAYQHDARWSIEGSEITLFDNAIDDFHTEKGITRGLRLKIDQVTMTAEIVTEYYNQRGVLGKSQGSLQDLPNGNVLLGYGNTAAWTEFSKSGEVLCDVHFAPRSRFLTGDVQSYRVFKFPWQGFPHTTPNVTVINDEPSKWRVYASWNGATEIHKWVLQGTMNPNVTTNPWRDLETVQKVNYETSFDMQKWYPRYLRVVAKDAKSEVLGITPMVDGIPEDQIQLTEWDVHGVYLTPHEDSIFRLIVSFCTVMSLAMAVKMAYSTWLRRMPRLTKLAP
jgi:hypothetical protein